MSRPFFSLAFSLGVSLALQACGPGGQNGDGGSHPLAPTAIPDPMHAASTADDLDGDGVANATDNCPSVANTDQRDACNYDAPPPVPTGTAGVDGASYLSWVRARTGLGAVTEDTALSHGCQVHLNYLQALSTELGHAVLEHTEDLSKPYASAEGNAAGVDSVLALGNATIAGSIDVWINSLYHRLPLLHPGLTRVGVATLGQYGCIQYRRGTTD
ncbi:MAG: CAP domain-containing protein, partial [Deltaproteobacteria bacterium]